MSNLVNVFTILFVVMGPMKVSLVFANITADMEPGKRRGIALKAVSIAAVIGLLFIFAGSFLMQLFHISAQALMLAGGAILFIFAVQLVLAPVGGSHYVDKDDSEAYENIAVYPLAIPLMASPLGLVSLTMGSAINADKPAHLVGMALILMVVMVINLCILLFIDRILKFIPPQVIIVAERILGLLLAALGVETILNGLRALGVISAAGH